MLQGVRHPELSFLVPSVKDVLVSRTVMCGGTKSSPHSAASLDVHLWAIDMKSERAALSPGCR